MTMKKIKGKEGSLKAMIDDGPAEEPSEEDEEDSAKETEKSGSGKE